MVFRCHSQPRWDDIVAVLLGEGFHESSPSASSSFVNRACRPSDFSVGSHREGRSYSGHLQLLAGRRSSLGFPPGKSHKTRTRICWHWPSAASGLWGVAFVTLRPCSHNLGCGCRAFCLKILRFLWRQNFLHVVGNYFYFAIAVVHAAGDEDDFIFLQSGRVSV